PTLCARTFGKIERRFAQIAHKRGLAVIAVGVLALALRLALLPLLPVPKPAIHDEFGYLLLADPFAHGRMTHPTHPMWIHFETFHVNHVPTYTAMTYPAQGVNRK